MNDEEVTSGQENVASQRDVDRLNNYIIGVMVVVVGIVLTLVFALGAIVTSSLADKRATSQSLINQVQAQNTQIQVLTNQIKNSTVTPH